MIACPPSRCHRSPRRPRPITTEAAITFRSVLSETARSGVGVRPAFAGPARRCTRSRYRLPTPCSRSGDQQQLQANVGRGSSNVVRTQSTCLLLYCQTHHGNVRQTPDKTGEHDEANDSGSFVVVRGCKHRHKGKGENATAPPRPARHRIRYTPSDHRQGHFRGLSALRFPRPIDQGCHAEQKKR